MDEEAHHRFLNAEVDKALRVLGEHFDSLQVVGTFVDDEGMTHCLTRGVGNFYARVGAVQEFLERDAAQTTARAIGEVMSDDEGESGFD